MITLGMEKMLTKRSFKSIYFGSHFMFPIINASPTITPVDIHSDSESEEIADSVDKKILKPRGQLGHPRCGDYSLDFVL